MAEREWTDDDLRVAVASESTYRGVMRRLGLADGSLNYLKKQIARLELDASHFDSHPKNLLCPDADLRELARTSKTSTEVLEKLGMELRGSHFRKLNRRLAALDIDTSHFSRRRVRGGKRGTRWSTDELRAAVESSVSVAQVLRKLGLIAAGGNYDSLQRRIREHGIDTSHFTGMGWNVGMKYRPVEITPLDEVLVRDRPTKSHALKKRLFAAGLKDPTCEVCGWAERAPDGRVPVELDHINGDKDDNRLENLRILCPNCHSLQPTHRGLNQKRAKLNAGRASECRTLLW